MIDKPFIGGGQRHLLSLVKSLDKTRFDVSVSSAGGGPLEEAVLKEGIPHTAIPIQKRLNKQSVNFLVPLLKKNDYDIIHTHGGVAGLFGRWAARKAHTPVIVHTLHGIHYFHYRNPWNRWFSVKLERFFSQFTSALIFVSDADRQQGQKHRLAPEDKMHTIQNGIDFAAVSSMRLSRKEILTAKKDLGLHKDSPIIGTIARLHRQKGLIYLLKSMVYVRQEYPSARLIIIGDGPEKEKLLQEASNLSIQDCVLFLGEQKDASRFLSVFDIFALSSLWEGLPYVLMEAAAFEKPVVATRIDGVKEMVSHEKTGLLVPPRDSFSLGQTLLRMLKETDFAEGLGKKLYERSSLSFPLTKMVTKIQDLYFDLYEKYR